ncbi:MAG: hypothetical protein AUJ96_07245 [Armatimonadetes bacterium CG2_30_66_41]|nr:hypothetical protein [Armatimonadota bacterium]OIP07517.1 MAG: hypothetical protein AUJ96_07245 [Armatimonadetes bacterium CG2_30_66_41]NCO94080.1 hypothetical protein [Armatimonadota bacterium]NCP31798.1 hypothetical protein [Armatimonadota bacterium]NCQ27038.1 hypothetical protein [Armatimonadota bacterium]
MVDPGALVESRLYPSQQAVVRDALRSLLHEKPQLRVELALRRYVAEDLSVGKTAHLAGLSFDRTKELLVQRGIEPRLGPDTVEDAREEIAALERMLAERER